MTITSRSGSKDSGQKQHSYRAQCVYNPRKVLRQFRDFTRQRCTSHLQTKTNPVTCGNNTANLVQRSPGCLVPYGKDSSPFIVDDPLYNLHTASKKLLLLMVFILLDVGPDARCQSRSPYFNQGVVNSRLRWSLGSDRRKFSSFPWSPSPFQGFFRGSSRSYERFTTRSWSPSGLFPVVISVSFPPRLQQNLQEWKKPGRYTLSSSLLSLVSYQITVWTWNSTFLWTARYKNS